MGIGESIVSVGKSAVNAGTKLVDKAVDVSGDVLDAVTDPVGFVEDQLSNLSLEQIASAATLGLNNVASDLARDAGLGPLVDGINKAAEVVDDVVAIVARFARCTPWLGTPAFHTLWSILYAARSTGLISSKSGAVGFVRRPEVAKVLGNIPIAQMLDCAIEVAFSAPDVSRKGRGGKTGGGFSGAAAAGAQAGAVVHNSLFGAIAKTVGGGVDRAAVLAIAGPSTVNVVSRAENKLDVFIARPDGAVVCAAWQTGDKAWRGWWEIAGVRAIPGAPITAVSRSTDKLDVFMTGRDGRVYTAAWEQGRDTAWRGWWPVGDLKTIPGAAVAAVSRSTDKLDVFVTGRDGRIYTAAWEQGRDTAWRGWWPVASQTSVPGAPLTAVSRSTDKLDVFVTGRDGRIHTAAWEQGRDRAWRGWWPVGELKTLPGAAVGAVSRSRDKLDIFVTTADGRIHTAAWQPGDRAWRGWWPVGSGRAAPGAPVSAVSRSADKLDIFTVGRDSRVWTAAWQPGDTNWRGWWAIGDLSALPASRVDATCRSKDMLDVFVRGRDIAIYSAAWEQGRDKDWRGWWRLI